MPRREAGASRASDQHERCSAVWGELNKAILPQKNADGVGLDNRP